MKATISILTLQEVINKTKCNNLVNSAVIEFKDGAVRTKGSGIEIMPAKKGDTATKAPGKVDGSMSFGVSYPTPVQEPGEVAIANLGDFLSKIGVFEKEDLVSAYVQDNKLILSRELPVLVLDYDLADKKFIPTAHKEQQDVIYGSPVILKNLKGASKEFPFTTEIVMDASQLKAFASMASKIGVTKVPLQVKDGKFISVLKGTGSGTMSEIKTDKITGTAQATYGAEVIDIFNTGFGLATLRFSDNLMLYIHYEMNQQKTDYTTVPVANT